MKKNIVLLFVVYALCISSYGITQIKVITESDLTIKNLFVNYSEKGIKNVSYVRYDVDQELVSEEFEKIGKIIIDTDKNLYTEIIYYPNYSRSLTTFDEQKNIKDISIYYSDNSLMSRVITNYNPDNTVNDKIYYFGNSITFKTNYIYNSGNVVKIEYADSVGKILNVSKLFYDNTDKLIQEEKYNEKDSLEIVYNYSYDKLGNCTEEMVNYPQSDFKTKVLYKYDENGKKTEKSVYSLGDKMVSKTDFKYNDRGLLIDESEFSLDGKMISKNTYRYDEKGNKTEWRYANYLEEFEYLYSYEYGY